MRPIEFVHDSRVKSLLSCKVDGHLLALVSNKETLWDVLGAVCARAATRIVLWSCAPRPERRVRCRRAPPNHFRPRARNNDFEFTGSADGSGEARAGLLRDLRRH